LIALLLMLTRLLLTSAIVATLCGCSAWLDSRKQTVSVQTFESTQPIAGVSCQLVNDQGQWSVTTPGEVQVITSAQDLVVTCTKPDSSIGISNAIARPSPGYLANPTAAVVVPVGAPSSVDQLARGVAQAYPANIHVVMNEEILVTGGQ